MSVTTGSGSVTATAKASGSSVSPVLSYNAASAPITVSWGFRGAGIVDQASPSGSFLTLFGTAGSWTTELMPWAKQVRVDWTVEGVTSFFELWTDYTGGGGWVVSRGSGAIQTSVERGWIENPTVALTSIGSSASFLISGTVIWGSYSYTVPAGEVLNYVSGIGFKMGSSFPEVETFGLSARLVEHVWYQKSIAAGGIQESVAYWWQQTVSTGTGTVPGVGGDGNGCGCVTTRVDPSSGTTTRVAKATGSWDRRQC